MLIWVVSLEIQQMRSCPQLTLLTHQTAAAHSKPEVGANSTDHIFTLSALSQETRSPKHSRSVLLLPQILCFMKLEPK